MLLLVGRAAALLAGVLVAAGVSKSLASTLRSRAAWTVHSSSWHFSDHEKSTEQIIVCRTQAALARQPTFECAYSHAVGTRR